MTIPILGDLYNVFVSIANTLNTPIGNDLNITYAVLLAVIVMILAVSKFMDWW